MRAALQTPLLLYMVVASSASANVGYMVNFFVHYSPLL